MGFRFLNENKEKMIQIAALFFFLAGLAFAVVFLLLVYKGGAPWAYIFYADKPFENLAISVACFFGWYFLKHGIIKTRREWLLITARVILVIVSLGLALVAAEVAFRVYLFKDREANSFKRWKELHAQGKKIPVRTRHPMSLIIRPCENQRLIYELQPNLDMEFGRRRLKTNSAGMRASREYPVERLPNSVRILGLGDSGMFGWDLEQDENYMDILEKNLNDRKDGVTYEALNFAVPGYNTRLECEHLRGKGLAYKPDIVVIGWCDNDYSLPFFLLQETDFRRRDMSFIYCLLFNRKKLLVSMGPPEFRELRKFDKKEVLPEITEGTDVKGVQQAMRDLNDLGHQKGFHLLVFGPMDGRIVKICQDAGISYYNTRDNIPADKYPKEYAIHYMHPRKEGHAVLAKALEKYLTEQDWLKPK